jgi:hypothetical protein
MPGSVTTGFLLSPQYQHIPVDITGAAGRCFSLKTWAFVSPVKFAIL